MARTIKCVDCGNTRSTQQPNTRYCHRCALYHNIVWVAARTRRCLDCDKRFAPLHRNDELCGECDFLGKSHRVTGKCIFCERERELLRDEVRVCLPCVKHPKKRKQLKTSLAKGRRRDRDTNLAGA